MRRSRGRAVLLAIAVAAGSIAGAAGSALPAGAATCSATRTSTMSFNGTANTVKRVYVYQDGVAKVVGTSTLRSTFDTGTTRITVTACKESGTWKALTYGVDRAFADLTLTVDNGAISQIKPAGGRYQGFGVVTKRLTSSTIENYGLVCTATPKPLTILGVVHAVLGLPLPGPYGVGLGAYLADKAIPNGQSGSSYKCGRMTDDLNLSWKFDSTGAASLSIPSGTFAVADRQDTDDYCNTHANCSAIIRTEISLHKG